MPRQADGGRGSQGSVAAALADAQALIRAGRPADAVDALERLTVESPRDPAAWVALGVARAMLSRHAEAIDASSRAVALAPRAPGVQLAHGDVLRVSGRIGAARRAYAAAVELAPNDADGLNKLAGIERIERDFDAAQAHLDRALALAPAHPYVQVNLATLAVERAQVGVARRRLSDALRLPRLPREAADEAAATLAMLDEHDALAPAIERSRVEGSPAAIEAALRMRGEPSRRDEYWVAALEQVIERTLREAPIDDAFARGRPASARWPAIEAHHNFRRLGKEDAIPRTIELVASGRADPEAREVRDYADVVARRGASLAFADGIAGEAWLRHAHACMAASRPEYFPGQVKPVNNLLHSDPPVSRPAPLDVAGTLRTAMSRIDAALPPGAWRACLRYCAIIEIHPFRDGNGRLARHLLNRSLESVGLFPCLRPGNDDEELARRYSLARRERDMRDVAAWFADASRYAADLDARWSAR